MAEQLTFGRRRVAVQAPPQPVYRLEDPNPQLEAFRASLKSAPLSEDAEFAQWRRRQRPRRLMVILVGVAFLAPGVICFIFQAPWWVSLGLEIAGFAATDWRRRERKRQSKEIAAWTPSSNPGA